MTGKGRDDRERLLDACPSMGRTVGRGADEDIAGRAGRIGNANGQNALHDLRLTLRFRRRRKPVRRGTKRDIIRFGAERPSVLVRAGPCWSLGGLWAAAIDVMAVEGVRSGYRRWGPARSAD